VVHFDAAWDVSHRPIVRQKLRDAEQCLGESVNFGEVDCDENADLAASIPVTSVPLVAYYRNGRLVAALVGQKQNVQLRLERLLRGESIGYKDGADNDDVISLWPYTR
jgi:thioredoxin-like negative regulator of GroEL